METHSFDATRNTYADRIGQRGYEASDTVTWRPTTVGRATTIAANDGASRPETFREFMAAAPASVIIVAGGMVAAIVGAMLGGALHI
jgi:hypothetical protein